jgi:hypothetical protein
MSLEDAMPNVTSVSEHQRKQNGNGVAGGTQNLPPGIVDSLGEALAGVTMNGGSSTTSHTFASTGAFLMGNGSAADRNNDGWGNYADPAAPTAVPFSTGAQRESSSGSGAVDRNHESLERFLSQSPSQTLGDDVFKLSHPNLPALEEEQHQHRLKDSNAFRYSGTALAPGPSNGMAQSHHHHKIAPESRTRRADSPSCSGTGTTTSSRSVSPYTNSTDSRAIHAYYSFSHGNAHGNAGTADGIGLGGSVLPPSRHSFAEDERSAYSLGNAHASHASLATLDAHRSRLASDRSNGHMNSLGSNAAFGTAPTFDRVPSYSPASIDPPLASSANGQQQQPQVLYMAVPSPDGRGQVFQAVQMVQVPGRGQVFQPVQTAGAHTPVQNNRSLDGNHPIMALPPLGGAAMNDHGDSLSDNQYAANNSDVYIRDDFLAGNDAISGPYDTTVASLYAAPQRPPLDILLGQIRRLSRDQVGCRLVQQALDEEGTIAATLILKEGLPFWGEAMVDPFGNYLFQKILEKVTPQERIMLVKSVSPRLVNASLNLHGTRSVQKLVELCAQDEHNQVVGANEESAADILTYSLAPAAARLCIDSHGNHVIQRILLKLNYKHSKFVFDAVALSVGDVARHRHGCCVIQRCLDSQPTEARSHLVLRIVDKSLELMQDAYGNYVVQYVLDVCSDQDVQAVCESVAGRVNLLAIQKFSSNVMEKCLERCSDRIKEMYLDEMSRPERIRELMMDPFGNYVVQRALSVATHTQAIRLVEAMRPHLLSTQTSGPNGQRNGGVRNTAGGRRIIAKICRRFPNFTLNPVGTEEELYGQNRGPQPPGNGGRRQHQQSQQQQHQPVLRSSYNGGAVGKHQTRHQPAQHYNQDPRLSHGLAQQQQQQQQSQQSYYNMGPATPYYDHFTGGHGGYTGL